MFTVAVKNIDMCSLVTPQVWEGAITASVLHGFPIENVWENLSVMITKL